MLEAVLLAAQTEGLLLDPVYSGKAMAGLIGHVRRGKFTRDQTVVFLHTGGTAALSAYAEAFAFGCPQLALCVAQVARLIGLVAAFPQLSNGKFWHELCRADGAKRCAALHCCAVLRQNGVRA